MIKLIIFDIGDVLIDFNDVQYVNYVAGKHRINKEKLAKELNPLREKMEYGAIGLQDAEDELSKRLKISKVNLYWVESYRKIAKLNRPVFNLVNHLHKRYKIALLSNVSRARYI